MWPGRAPGPDRPSSAGHRSIGTGKTRRVLAPGLCAWPGPAVAVSSKPDLFDLTRCARVERGPVWLLDLTGRASIPQGVQVVRFDPLSGVSSADDAVDLAGLLLAVGGVGGGGGVSDGAFWAASATHPLAALLLAAARSGQGIAWAVRAVSRPDAEDGTPSWVEAAAILNADDLAAAQVDALAALIVAEDRFRQSVMASMNVSLAPWRRESVLASHASTWHPRDLGSGGTLHVIAPATGVAAGAAVAVVDQLIGHWRWTPDLPPLLVTIDEAANTAPLPDLPTMVTESRGLGVSLVVAVQHTGQLRLRWGEAGADVLRHSFPATLLLRGARERALLEEAAWSLGETEAWSSGVSAAQRHRSARMVGASPAGLLPGDFDHARLLTTHEPPRLVTIPDCSRLAVMGRTAS